MYTEWCIFELCLYKYILQLAHRYATRNFQQKNELNYANTDFIRDCKS